MSTLSILAKVVGAAALSQAPAIEYEVSNDAAQACWRVRFQATGIDPAAGELSLVLEDWGEWTEVEGYLREFSVRPPVRKDPSSASRFLLDTPPDWDGTLEGSYVLPLASFGSPAQQAHGLMPVSDGSTVRGFSSNTLFDVLQGGQPLDAMRTIRFVAGPGTSIGTGWGGITTEEQTVELQHPIDNVPLFFGKARAASGEDPEGLRYEVAQFGAEPDATRQMLDVVCTLIPLYGRHCGQRPEETVRLFITPWEGGGTGTDHGYIVGAHPGALDDGPSTEYVRLIAHELFHGWLGGGFLKSPDDESLVWFHEGFTEYFAVWHVAASGLAPREWFAERIAVMEAEARGSEAYGKVSFGDPGVRWRDGNGPNETLGYRGGALLAFFADKELRRSGGTGLLQLLADLMQEDDRRLDRAKIRAWMEAAGLEQFYARHVLGPASFPPADEALEELGFELSESDASLTYLGIQVAGDAPLGSVVAVDPEGPAARADVKVGDRIQGYSPSRSRPPRIAESVKTPYRFGLNCIASGAEVAEIDVLRDGTEVKLRVEPRLISGGVRTAYRASGEKLESFFKHDPQQRVR